MAVELKLPKLGMTMESAKITEWKKGDGERVENDEVVLTIETDKVSYEVTAPATGILRTLAQVDDELPVGARIALIAADQAEYAALGSQDAAASAPAPGAEEPPKPAAKMAEPGAPSAGPEGKIRIVPAARRLAQEKGIDIRLLEGTGPGGRITKDDVLRFAGQATSTPAATTQAAEPGAPSAGPAGKIRIAPVARKLAQAKGIDIRLLKGTGPSGRIVKDDVLRFASQAAAPQPSSPEPGEADAGRVEVIKRTQQRRIVAQRMTESLREAAQTTHSNDVDATALVELRERLLAQAEKQTGVRVTITDLLMKATACALQEHPIINSRYTEDADIVYKDIHMGMAMSVKEGELLVPVIWDIDKKSVVEIAKARVDCLDRAKRGRLTPDDIKGSTFTLSALGMFGLERFVAIINRPENAILAAGAILDKPWVHAGAVAVRKVMNVTLSYDHRTIYGAEAARFMATLKSYIEDPKRVLEEADHTAP